MKDNIQQKATYLISIFFIVLFQTTQSQSVVDAKGTYVYRGKTTRKNGDIYGYYGNIQVKKISPNRVVINFYICRGAPGYNSGSFIDTLDFKNNQVMYSNAELDSSCKIKFDFDPKGVKVTQESELKSFGCDFGHGVTATGYFIKTSSKQPILRDTITGDLVNK